MKEKNLRYLIYVSTALSVLSTLKTLLSPSNFPSYSVTDKICLALAACCLLIALVAYCRIRYRTVLLWIFFLPICRHLARKGVRPPQKHNRRSVKEKIVASLLADLGPINQKTVRQMIEEIPLASKYGEQEKRMFTDDLANDFLKVVRREPHKVESVEFPLYFDVFLFASDPDLKSKPRITTWLQDELRGVSLDTLIFLKASEHAPKTDRLFDYFFKLAGTLGCKTVFGWDERTDRLSSEPFGGYGNVLIVEPLLGDCHLLAEVFTQIQANMKKVAILFQMKDTNVETLRQIQDFEQACLGRDIQGGIILNFSAI